MLSNFMSNSIANTLLESVVETGRIFSIHAIFPRFPVKHNVLALGAWATSNVSPSAEELEPTNAFAIYRMLVVGNIWGAVVATAFMTWPDCFSSNIPWIVVQRVSGPQLTELLRKQYSYQSWRRVYVAFAC